MTTEGNTLWARRRPSTEIWPQLTVAPNGLRLAWATLDVGHSIDSFAPMDSDDVKEQSVTVFDAATGDIALVSPLSPILDFRRKCRHLPFRPARGHPQRPAGPSRSSRI